MIKDIEEYHNMMVIKIFNEYHNIGKPIKRVSTPMSMHQGSRTKEHGSMM